MLEITLRGAEGIAEDTDGEKPSIKTVPVITGILASINNNNKKKTSPGSHFHSFEVYKTQKIRTAHHVREKSESENFSALKTSPETLLFLSVVAKSYHAVVSFFRLRLELVLCGFFYYKYPLSKKL